MLYKFKHPTFMAIRKKKKKTRGKRKTDTHVQNRFISVIALLNTATLFFKNPFTGSGYISVVKYILESWLPENIINS